MRKENLSPTKKTKSSKKMITEKNLLSDDLIRLYPYGMTATTDGLRPMLLLKDHSGEWILSVPLNALEAGVTLTQSNKMTAPATPHRVAELLMKSMHLKISRCVFQEMRVGRQWVKLDIENHPLGQNQMVVRADEAMSLCLHLEVPLFASRDFILRSRDFVSELAEQSQNLLANPKVLERTHPYLM